jgi:S-adenosylmethionine:tRNA ribosyltransferase-isomerase
MRTHAKGSRHDAPERAPIPGVWDFVLPHDREARAPAEERGIARDGVRLMVTREGSDKVVHRTFSELDRILTPRDLLIVNTSGTRNAALAGIRAGRPVAVHLSTWLEGDLWTVEIRTSGGATAVRDIRPAETIDLGPADDPVPSGRLTILAPYRQGRLWIAEVETRERTEAYCARYGTPIRYGYVRRPWPPAYYQTVFARDRGSSEMPSAGRPFTDALVARLRKRGIQFADVTLHTGVASLESHERPYPERFMVPQATADAINRARSERRRVIAVGTTCVRAVETVADGGGVCRPGSGWTNVVVSPERPMQAIDGLLTGFHEPGASHLAMLRGLASERHLRRAYEAAIEAGYLWHEFGDSHLILR